jgi:hypothetical protein
LLLSLLLAALRQGAAANATGSRDSNRSAASLAAWSCRCARHEQAECKALQAAALNSIDLVAAAAAAAAAAETAIEVLPRWPLGPVDVRGMSKQNAKHCKLLH